ncbi:Retinol-binding protein pinta [Chionoecetes opilio]|uniref:Retinol-binding protein pinta n=1 Tax=Chionoecetes opilio TaxID=41210 RepID=A0A8J4YDB3_CHIOP|nr:Retinol-binding protein pinta [Chionoecetes opilio]
MGGEYVCTLSPELLQRAKDEINEDPERRAADIEHIRDWLKHQPHINARMDDWTILRFLRGCKFSLERTKEKMDMFYTCKALCPEWYKNRDPQDKKLRSILELGTFLPLPGHDPEGRKVIIIRTAVHDPKDHSMDEVFKATHLISDIMLDEDEPLSITGVVQLLDMEGVTAAHAMQMTPAVVKKAMTIWQHKLARSSVVLPLPGYDVLGRKVLLCRWGIYAPNEVSMDELIKTTSMTMDVMQDEDEQSNLVGINMLGDCTGLTVSHAIAFTPSHAKKCMVMWQKLKDLTCAHEYAVAVSIRFDVLGALEDPVELWHTLKRETLQAAKECIGERPRSRRGFVSTETLEKIEESRAARGDKERYVRSLAQDVEGHLNVNDLRPAYRALKKLRFKSRSRASAIRAADGRLVSDMHGQMARWAEYFGQLFTVDPPIEQLHTTGLRAVDADPPIDETAPILDEVREAVAKLRVERRLVSVISVRSSSKLGHHHHSYASTTTTTTYTTTTTTNTCSVLLSLPGYDSLGRKVLLERWASYDPATTPVDFVLRAITTVADVLLEEDEQSAITGCVVLSDCSCLSVPHVVALTPAVARKAMVLWQRWASYDPATTPVDFVLRAITTVADVLLEEDEQSAITGCVVLSDCSCLSVPHVMALTPAVARKAMVLWQGRRLILTRPGVFDPSTTTLDELTKVMMMMCDIWMEEDEAQSVVGVVFVEDMKELSIVHLAALSPVAIKKMMTIFQIRVQSFISAADETMSKTNQGLILPLSLRSTREPRLVLARPAVRDPTTTDMNDAAKAMLLMMDLLLEEDEGVAITGVDFVLDSGTMTWQHAAQLNPSLIKKAAIIMQLDATGDSNQTASAGPSQNIGSRKGGNVMLVMPLPCIEGNHRFTVLARPGLRDTDTSSMDEMIKVVLLLLDLMLEEEETLGILGFQLLVDAGNMTFAHAAQMTPPMMKKILTLIQDGYPMRPKGLNYINTPAAFDTVFNIFKSFMKEKMKRRVHIHGSDMESLYKQVPREMLPVEYGGTNGTIEEIKNYWLQRLDARRDWLLEDEKYCVDESKRPGKPKTSADLFGIEGSFRKLNVD